MSFRAAGHRQDWLLVVMFSKPLCFPTLYRTHRYRPVSGNKEGSFMTMLSMDGLIFGIINIIGNFGTVFVDQAYWQGAIAAKPSATYKG